MSGISSITSSPLTSGASSSHTSGTSNALSTTGLSSVGASLLTTGQAPDVTAPKTAAPSNTVSSYQTEYQNLLAYDTQELLYASFLTPAAGLANADSVLEQAAQLLGTPGSPGPALSTSPASSTSSSATSSSTTPASSTSASSSSAALNNLPSVASILAASDQEAQQTLQNYANAPVGSSIIDYQA
jgi:hypothetical protein